MTFDEYQSAVAYAHRQHPEWRAGQTAFNVLMLTRPDLSEQIRATNLDPFGDDALIPKFYQWVKANWLEQEN